MPSSVLHPTLWRVQSTSKSLTSCDQRSQKWKGVGEEGKNLTGSALGGPKLNNMTKMNVILPNLCNKILLKKYISVFYIVCDKILIGRYGKLKI